MTPHQQLVQDELAKVELRPDSVKYPPKMSYKKNRYDRNPIEEGTQLGYKSPVILEVKDGRNITGYMLAEVLDWEEVEGSYFTGRSCFIVRVLEVSSAGLEKHVGHLRTARMERNWWGEGRFNIVNVGRGIWPQYQIKAK